MISDNRLAASIDQTGKLCFWALKILTYIVFKSPAGLLEFGGSVDGLHQWDNKLHDLLNDVSSKATITTRNFFI